jgi:long-subunit acyl-CoA synthetase (AMP-forming)
MYHVHLRNNRSSKGSRHHTHQRHCCRYYPNSPWLTLVAGVDKALGKTNYPNGGIDHNDFLLCFLPLAHILEFVYELCAILWGGTIGYATVKTLTEASTRNCKGDIKEFRPTILVG